MQDVIKRLRQMATIPDVRYDKVVVVLDTLKKCTDLIQKNNIKEFMGLLRQLTGRGMTVIFCLIPTSTKTRTENQSSKGRGT